MLNKAPDKSLGLWGNESFNTSYLKTDIKPHDDFENFENKHKMQYNILGLMDRSLSTVIKNMRFYHSQVIIFKLFLILERFLVKN